MTNASDEYPIDIMTGEHGEVNRLQQCMPYTGIIDEETSLKILARYQEARQLNDDL